MRGGVALAVIVAALVACGDNTPGRVTIIATEWTDALQQFAALTPGDRLTVAADATPTADASGFQIAVVDDAAMPLEGYRVDPASGTERTWMVHAHDVLGAQYGVAAALEHLGFRFRHPYDAYVPSPPRAASGDDGALSVVHQPQVRVRGLQLHTLHPIESYWAFWEDNPEDAHRVIDWVVKNRGNYLQWVALDDILDPARRAAWQAYTRDIIDYAHMRGIRVGINIQLFSQSSLQQAFTLVDSATDPVPDQVAAALPLIVDDLPWDVYSLSFGEFFDADPQAFIDAVDETATALFAIAPNAEMHAVIHVGGTQLVTYMGQTIIYYFLVAYTDPRIIADVHSVMYYDLFEDAGGAYQMQDFSEHREFLVSKMCANAKASYFPEDAYWIAFDDSVPQYLPLYIRSRLYDLQQLQVAAPAPCSPLDEHLVFSSGWEWGYWLHDTASLRMSYELPTSQEALIADQLSPDIDPVAATVVSELADAQHDALIGERLAAYIASRDALIDAGRGVGVISQPDRVTFDDLAADPEIVPVFQTAVMEPLADFRTTVEALATRADALHLPDGDIWAAELRDGVDIDRARVRFIYAAYQATIDHLAGDDTAATADRAVAQAALDDATTIVHRRDANLHDPNPEITGKGANYTVYAFGYLYQADVLCYWHRELDQVDAILGNTTTAPPSCVF